MRYELTAKRIREALEDLNMTQQELADLSQIGKSSISHYVNGSNEPGNKSAYSLAQVLKVNPAWLMGLDAPKYLPPKQPLFSEPIESMKRKQDIEKAIEMYEKYINAIPQVQDAVDALLKVPRPDP